MQFAELVNYVNDCYIRMKISTDHKESGNQFFTKWTSSLYIVVLHSSSVRGQVKLIRHCAQPRFVMDIILIPFNHSIKQH